MKYGPSRPGELVPWQPSTWPPAPARWGPNFHNTFSQILRTTVLQEIGNVIQDARAANGGLDHRGHVVALSLFCAVDMASAYAYQTDRVGARYRRFIESHFPTEYRVHAAELYRNYRNSTVHSWHLFKASILPDRQPIEVQGGTLVFGLLHFFEALETAIEHFLVEAQHDAEVQAAVLARYAKLRASARS